MAKKYLPFPIEYLAVQTVHTLTPLQFGILMRFIQHWWKTGLDLPKVEFQLYHIARCDFKQWSGARANVYKAMEEIIPKLQEYRTHKKAMQVVQAKNGVNAYKSRINKKYKGNETFSDEKTGHMVLTPVAPGAEPYKKDWFDGVERKKALKSKEKDDGSTFTD